MVPLPRSDWHRSLIDPIGLIVIESRPFLACCFPLSDSFLTNFTFIFTTWFAQVLFMQTSSIGKIALDVGRTCFLNDSTKARSLGCHNGLAHLGIRQQTGACACKVAVDLFSHVETNAFRQVHFEGPGHKVNKHLLLSVHH